MLRVMRIYIIVSKSTLSETNSMSQGNSQSDYWQLSVRAAIDGERRGILLDVYHPTMQIYQQVIIWGGEVNQGRTTPRNFAERQAGKLARLLKEKGVSIPDSRSRIADLIEDKWID
jgi:hypothetical protein